MAGTREDCAVANHLVTARTSLDVALAALGVARALCGDVELSEQIAEVRERLEMFIDDKPESLQTIINKLTSPVPIGSLNKPKRD